MGADLPEFDKGEKEVRDMSEEARGYLAHHLNNSLCGLICALELGDIERAKGAAEHMVDDLNRVGINSGGDRAK